MVSVDVKQHVYVHFVWLQDEEKAMAQIGAAVPSKDTEEVSITYDHCDDNIELVIYKHL